MGVTPTSDGKALQLSLGEPATRPKWSGNPTYSEVTSGYHLSDSPGPHLFCKSQGSVSALLSS